MYLFVCLRKGVSHKATLQNCEKTLANGHFPQFFVPHGFVARLVSLFLPRLRERKNAKFVDRVCFICFSCHVSGRFCFRSKSVLVGSRGFKWYLRNAVGTVWLGKGRLG